MIYLDSNATTQVDPLVLESMLPFLRESYTNPSASYAAARHVRKALEQARQQLASLLSAAPENLVFTSCGTESINTVHASVQQLWPERRQLIIGGTEHPAVLESAERWKRQGGTVAITCMTREGLVDLDSLREHLQAVPTALVSIMWANNETGVISPLEEIVEIAHAAQALVHTDAVQMLGKKPLSVAKVPVDFLSLSGHKIHAPKGIGALYLSPRVRFQPLLVGGGQEAGRRSGTENVPGIVALGQAAAMMEAALQDSTEDRLRQWRDGFEARLLAALPDTIIHGMAAPRLPTTSSLCFPGVDAAGLLILMDKQGIACSAGSACHTASLHPSHVLEAMGYDARHASSTLRFSFSRLNTETEVQTAAEALITAVQKLRALWQAEEGPVVLA